MKLNKDFYGIYNYRLKYVSKHIQGKGIEKMYQECPFIKIKEKAIEIESHNKNKRVIILHISDHNLYCNTVILK